MILLGYETIKLCHDRARVSLHDRRNKSTWKLVLQISIKQIDKILYWGGTLNSRECRQVSIPATQQGLSSAARITRIDDASWQRRVPTNCAGLAQRKHALTITWWRRNAPMSVLSVNRNLANLALLVWAASPLLSALNSVRRTKKCLRRPRYCRYISYLSSHRQVELCWALLPGQTEKGKIEITRDLLIDWF